MPTNRILSASALIERDTSTPDSAGDLSPNWVTVATEACAPPQPITDVLRRRLPGDVAATDFFSMLADGSAVQMGMRFTSLGVAYRVEARKPWASGLGTLHVAVGLKVFNG